MYCPSCGVALTQGLSYCNHCGAHLSIVKRDDGAPKSFEKSIESTVWAIVGVTATVLGIMVAVMALMIGAKLSREYIVLFMALMFLTLLVVDGVFIWQLLRLNRRAGEARYASQPERLDTKELDARREQALPEPRMSVTEDATQMFEPGYEEQRTK